MAKAAIATTANFLTLAPSDAGVVENKLERATHVYARLTATKVAETANGEFTEYGGDKARKLLDAFNARSPVSYIVAKHILIVASDDLPTVLVGFVDGEHLNQWSVLPTESWAAWRHDAFGGGAAPSPSNESLPTSNGVAK